MVARGGGVTVDDRRVEFARVGGGKLRVVGKVNGCGWRGTMDEVL